MLQTELSPFPTEGDNLANLCSDYGPFSFFPRRLRLQEDHPLFEDGDIHRHMYVRDLSASETEDASKLSVCEFTCHVFGCTQLFSSVEEYEHHYNSLHRHVCCCCRRSLPSARLLDIHLQEWHDSLFTVLSQRQDMYQCLVEGCGQKFRTSKQRKDHLITIHKYPPDFRFDKNKKDKGSTKTTRTREMKSHQQKATAMEEVMDSVCESEGVCELLLDEGKRTEPRVSEEEAAHIVKPSITEPLSDPNTGLHSTPNTSMESLRPLYSHRVPAAVCFGQGSIRGFRGCQGRRK
ncbi:hypothetical protein LDENG_00094960 [Lucifuga dentata]|nr:hypothetical protein LDENG_00094960 [Lucifuga dentata]